MLHPAVKPVILLAFANDAEAPLRELAVEQDALRAVFRQAERDGKFELVTLAAATADSIIQVFQEYDGRICILHYGGHSASDAIFLRGTHKKQKVIQPERLDQFLAQQKGLELIFLNSCLSLKQARRYHEVGAKVVLATDQNISDTAARKFARFFYTSLAAGKTITEAYEKAEAAFQVDGDDPFRGIKIKDEGEGEGIPWHLLPEEPHSWCLPLVARDLTRIPAIDLEKELFGREKDMQRLKDKLEKSSKVVLVNGLGGIGKTLLSMGYVQQYGGKYDHIVWINRGENLIESVALNEYLANTLGMPIEKDEELEIRFRRILIKLHQLPGKNLLVIDNAQEQVAQKEVYDHLPGAPGWRVLLTSRLDFGGFEQMRLDTLEAEAAIKLFRTYYSEHCPEEDLMALLQEIGFHTLTVELLAKLLDKLNNILSIPDLTEVLREKKLDDPNLQEKVWARHSGEERGIYMHLMKAFDLGRLTLTDHEKWLLKQFVVLPVEQYTVPTLAGFLHTEVLELNNTLNSLAAKGWLTRHEDKTFSIHRLIQQVVDYQLQLELDDVEALSKSMNLKMVSDAHSNPVTDNFPWLTHAESVLSYFGGEEGEFLTEFRSNIGVVFHSFGSLDKALSYHQRVLKSRLTLLGESHPDTAASFHFLGSIYHDMGYLDKALEMHERGLHILQNTKEASDKDFAATYNYLGIVYHDKGNHEKALSYYNKAYSLNEKAVERNHPELAFLKSNIAQVNRELGHLEVALNFHLEALAILDSQPTPNPLDLANSYNNIGLIYRDLNDIDRALRYHQDAVVNREANLPQHHPDLAAAYNNLALAYEESEQYEKAFEYYQKVPPILEKINPNHNNLAQCFSNIAGLYRKTGEYGIALMYSQKSLEIREENFKDLPLHPALAESYNNIGRVYDDLKKYALSIKYYLKAIEILESSPKVNRFNLATSYSNIGQAYFEFGQEDLALKFLKKSISIREELMNPKDFRLLKSYQDIERIHKSLRKPRHVRKFFKIVNKISKYLKG